ncbi:hypothetical protein [Bifidobacterium tissieri]|uniref:hypothetical protein n=1 Tax=Bifidobacterium tissieri TaxID=1630162 RepID=UPI001239D1C6|nr:hypothetical protein [Bifidobacterium tissieri]KAA8831813.1 hypothetical protein EM849_07335 [Bifidobacterium tissieri]
MSKSNRDEQIGQNLVQMRGSMSQAALAQRMRNRGYKWSAATVWAIEKGERPLKLTEATDVLSILGIDLHFGLDELLDTSEVLTRPIRQRIRSIRTARKTIDNTLPQLAEDAVYLATLASGLEQDVRDSGSDYLIGEICDALEYAGVSNMPDNAGYLTRSLGVDDIDSWIRSSAPYSTFLFGSREEIKTVRETLGLSSD